MREGFQRSDILVFLRCTELKMKVIVCTTTIQIEQQCLVSARLDSQDRLDPCCNASTFPRNALATCIDLLTSVFVA